MTTKPETPKSRKHHPDYLSQPEARRWSSGSLPALMAQLRKEARGMPDKAQWRVLSHGALISLKLRDGKFELRIARKSAPATAEGWDRWKVETQTFLRFFGREWKDAESVAIEGQCDVTYTITAPDEHPTCARCGLRPAIDVGKFKEDICRECALELGTLETAANKAQREEQASEQRRTDGVPAPDTEEPRPAEGGERALREASVDAGGRGAGAGEGDRREGVRDGSGGGEDGDRAEAGSGGDGDAAGARTEDSRAGAGVLPQEPAGG